ncbi:hypothetical protein GCG54_00006089 [Colletotrichum gloeosporioides]|uniref:Zn(2)-C6 fungal-type domain-containing protein n=1 Tax=Colletotrichum gloeosporioides TaxID=474922 RepID=A0A8H4FLA3_COLGL|nr:uncharacterized protein GCG54_00006089 [Colletotrichum gloeosporioides]KAF3806327.1 hypothetical protein GCG54_00006089 [Colletotrichum gloeosporioides]
MSTPRNGHRVTKKCSRACERCRSMKVKCSGRQPCARCERQSETCVYAPGIKRVLVPERSANRIHFPGHSGFIFVLTSCLALCAAATFWNFNNHIS